MEPPRPGSLPPIPPPPFIKPSPLPRVLLIAGPVLFVCALVYLVHASLRPDANDQAELWALALAKPRAAPPPLVRDERAGAIRVTAEPAEAVVWLNEEAVGAPPLALDSLRPGLHALRVEVGARAILDTLVYVEHGGVVEVHVAAPPPPRRRRGRRPSRADRALAEAMENLQAAPARAPVPLGSGVPDPARRVGE